MGLKRQIQQQEVIKNNNAETTGASLDISKSVYLCTCFEYMYESRNSSGPSCPKHRLFNELFSGPNVNCSSKFNV